MFMTISRHAKRGLSGVLGFLLVFQSPPVNIQHGWHCRDHSSLPNFPAAQWGLSDTRDGDDYKFQAANRAQRKHIAAEE